MYKLALASNLEDYLQSAKTYATDNFAVLRIDKIFSKGQKLRCYGVAP